MVEVIVVGIILAIFTGMLGIILGNRKKVTEQEFDNHKSSSNPHIACPVHESMLNSIERKLEKIDEKIDRLIAR